jgi:hypothetical protein
VAECRCLGASLAATRSELCGALAEKQVRVAERGRLVESVAMLQQDC